MTIFGKALVFILVVASLVGLGVSFWLYVDRREWKKEEEALRAEIGRRLSLQQDEELLLQRLQAIAAAGSYAADLPQPDPTKPLKRVTIRQAEQEVAKDRDDLNKKGGLIEEVNNLGVELEKLATGIRDRRKETEDALKEHARLRQVLQANPAFQDRIDQARKAQLDAERAQAGLKPPLVNALADVGILLKRHDQLTKRLDELKVGAASAGSRPAETNKSEPRRVSATGLR
jgi:hypothetical protein